MPKAWRQCRGQPGVIKVKTRLRVSAAEESKRSRGESRSDRWSWWHGLQLPRQYPIRAGEPQDVAVRVGLTVPTWDYFVESWQTQEVFFAGK